MIEAAAQMPADRHARSGRDSTIGISMTSGGMGKNDASAKEMTARAFSAWGPPARAIILLYRARSTQGLRSGAFAVAAVARKVAGIYHTAPCVGSISKD